MKVPGGLTLFFYLFNLLAAGRQILSWIDWDGLQANSTKVREVVSVSTSACLK